MKVIRVVRSSPHNLTSEFSRQARKDDTSKDRPRCSCHELAHLERYGTVRWTDGCLALTPISVSDLAGAPLRPRDPLPVTGRQARKTAVSALQRFASQVQGTVPDLDKLLPRGLFGERGTLLHTVR